MLKLMMVQGETINIGEDIKIQLASDTVYRANILIDAPKEVNIKRGHSEAVDESNVEQPPKKNVIIVNNKNGNNNKKIIK